MDDKFYNEEVFEKMDSESKDLIRKLSIENNMSIEKTTRFLSFVGMQMLLTDFEKKENESKGIN